MLDEAEVKVNSFPRSVFLLILLFSFIIIIIIFLLSSANSLFSSFYCFQIDVEPISVYAPMSEEAPVGPSASASVAFTEGTFPKKE